MTTDLITDFYAANNINDYELLWLLVLIQLLTIMTNDYK